MICDDCTWGDCDNCLLSQVIESIENSNAKTQNSNGDLIFRADAIKKVEHIMLRDKLYLRFNYKERRTALVDAITMIKKCPSTDAVKVVKCNECKWYQGVHGVQGHAPCEWFNKQVLWNDFCSNGEPYKGGNAE